MYTTVCCPPLLNYDTSQAGLLYVVCTADVFRTKLESGAENVALGRVDTDRGAFLVVLKQVFGSTTGLFVGLAVSFANPRQRLRSLLCALWAFFFFFSCPQQ